MNKVLKYIPIILIVIGAICVWVFDLHTYLSLSKFKEYALLAEDYIANHLLRAVIIYFFCYILVVALSIPGASIMTLLGGFLFGQWLGTALVVVAATLGASILFYSAKMASADLIKAKAGAIYHKMKSGFDKNAFSYLFTIRLIPLFPFVLINLLCAVMQIRFKIFFFATFLGIIPGSAIYVSAGVAMREVINQPEFSANVVLEPKVFGALIGLAVISILPLLYRKFSKK